MNKISKIFSATLHGAIGAQNSGEMVTPEEEGGRHGLDSNLHRAMPDGARAAMATAGLPPSRRPSHADDKTVKPSAIPQQVRDWDGTVPSTTTPARAPEGDEVARLQLALDASRRQLDDCRAALHGAEHRHAHRCQRLESDAREQNQRLLAMATAERERATRAEADLKGTRQLLQARTTELAAAQAFFGPADELSERDIATGVETLNEEIFQLSALLSDSVQVQEFGKAAAQAQDVVRKVIGEYVCEALVSGEDDARLSMLQVALQAAAIHWSQTHIQQWAENGKVDRCAKHLYELVLYSERADVATRWRTIMQKSLFASNGDDETELLSSLNSALDDVIKAAACVPKYVKDATDVQRALQEGTQAVVRLTLQLRRDITIGITSVQLSTLRPRPGHRYQRATMKAENSDEQRKSSTVGCGISLGLVRDHGTPQRHTLIKSNVFIVPE